MESLVSIHDVMPTTLPHVAEILAVLERHHVHHVTLLVVPGLAWTPDQLDQIRRWQDHGYVLAGHGWLHRCPTIRGLYHRLHSLLLSRDVAEHLSLEPAGRVELICRCFDWFEAQQLGSPSLYVPPAWALGRLPKDCHREIPFRFCETLSGLLDWSTGRLQKLPLVGFEADTRFRKWSLRLINASNRWTARCWGRPLRVSLHPYDLDLLLGKDIHRLLESVEARPYPVE